MGRGRGWNVEESDFRWFDGVVLREDEDEAVDLVDVERIVICGLVSRL